MKTVVVGFRVAEDEKRAIERAAGKAAGELAKELFLGALEGPDYKGLGVDALLEALCARNMDAHEYIGQIIEQVRSVPIPGA